MIVGIANRKSTKQIVRSNLLSAFSLGVRHLSVLFIMSSFREKINRYIKNNSLMEV